MARKCRLLTYQKAERLVWPGGIIANPAGTEVLACSGRCGRHFTHLLSTITIWDNNISYGYSHSTPSKLRPTRFSNLIQVQAVWMKSLSCMVEGWASSHFLGFFFFFFLEMPWEGLRCAILSSWTQPRKAGTRWACAMLVSPRGWSHFGDWQYILKSWAILYFLDIEISKTIKSKPASANSEGVAVTKQI